MAFITKLGSHAQSLPRSPAGYTVLEVGGGSGRDVKYQKARITEDYLGGCHTVRIMDLLCDSSGKLYIWQKENLQILINLGFTHIK